MCFNHLRLRLFQLKMNSGITFTPLCVFGFNKNYGQMENQLHVECKITHFSHKTNATFILPSNEFQDLKRERESPRTHQPITLLSHTHQPHFSSVPCTNLNSTHSPAPSSGRPAKPMLAQIVLHQDRTHSTSPPCSTATCLRSTTAITTPAIIQATLLHELQSTSKLPVTT